jgi:hypothetical protein
VAFPLRNPKDHPVHLFSRWKPAEGALFLLPKRPRFLGIILSDYIRLSRMRMYPGKDQGILMMDKTLFSFKIGSHHQEAR